MSAELSSVITGLQKVGASVVQSGKAHYRKVGVVLGARVAPVLPDGQPMPDFEALQLGLVSLVQSELDKTLAHEEAHVTELDEDREQLQARPKRRAPRRRAGEPAEPQPEPEAAPEAPAGGNGQPEAARPTGPTLVMS